MKALCKQQLSFSMFSELCRGLSSAMRLCYQFMERYPLSWQQPGQFEHSYGTPLAKTSIGFNPILVQKDSFGDKRFGDQIQIVSINVRILVNLYSTRFPYSPISPPLILAASPYIPSFNPLPLPSLHNTPSQHLFIHL